MSSTERMSLLRPQHSNDQLFQHSNIDDLASDPTVASSLKALFLDDWISVVLIAVPLSFASHFLHWGFKADFIISIIAIIPLAALLGEATEQCALKLGSTAGGLLNATFGNADEVIVGVSALLKGELRIAQTSLLGSILSNLLLVLGCSFIAGGFKSKEMTFQATAARASSSLMVLACTTLVIPAAYVASGYEHVLDDPDGTKYHDGLLFISRGGSLILLFCYATYLYFQLKSHAFLFETEEGDTDSDDSNEEEAKMEIKTAIASLFVLIVVTSFCVDYLVDSIDEFTKNFNISKTFVGLILLPLVSNAAEHGSSVMMAIKGKMDLTLAIAVGSAIQLAVGVIPLLVIVAWIVGSPLTLFFETFETIILFISVVLVNLLITNGRSNYLEGILLVALYFIICLAMWVS